MKGDHKIGDIVFTSGAFYLKSLIPARISNIVGRLVKAKPLIDVSYMNGYFAGSHGDYFTPEKALKMKPELIEKYPQYFCNQKTSSKISCCSLHLNSNFCPDCGQKINSK